MEEWAWTIKCVLGALYLRGAPRSAKLSPRKWMAVEAALRRAGCGMEGAARALRGEGLWQEATTLEEPDLLAWAERQSFLTPLDDSYPSRWLLRLGDGAPAAVWVSGHPPSGELIGIVGSRFPGDACLAFAAELGAEALRVGLSVVSGGAVGCDRAGVSQCGSHCVEVLPYGLRHHLSDKPALSLCDPREPFTRGAAMERNALIYAASEQTVVVHARFREGGTWTGAVDALRRKLCPMLVRESRDQAHQALVALGARPLSVPAALCEAMRQPEMQLRLVA